MMHGTPPSGELNARG